MVSVLPALPPEHGDEFRLLYVTAAGGRALSVPPGLSWLWFRRGALRLARAAARSPVRGGPPAQRWPLEPVGVCHQRFLLLANGDPSRGISVNGEPAPDLAVLGVSDEVRIPAARGVTFHVTIYRRPYVGPPPSALLGQPCPVCRSPLTRETRVYLCACGAGIHHEDESVPADRRLDCFALARDCPVCARPLDATEGYVHVPEGWEES